ncbi:hypothetical protein CYMTET_36556 [Cymbomonas tetramitiformis]|uniref:Uncharacterized protein n=1 Tax=Cymbomonas tetramitiformis TaxID=36881 RepID=A0AAE0CH28_9CHLO|nr:hypothetical protein CYMTET_36556 [Cymbomonas tetramitiformis]
MIRAEGMKKACDAKYEESLKRRSSTKSRASSGGSAATSDAEKKLNQRLNSLKVHITKKQRELALLTTEVQQLQSDVTWYLKTTLDSYRKSLKLGGQYDLNTVFQVASRAPPQGAAVLRAARSRAAQCKASAARRDRRADCASHA